MSSGPEAAPSGDARGVARPGRALAVALLLLVVAGLTFGRTLRHDFLVPTDDQLHVTDNPRLLPPSLSAAAWFWAHPYGGMYIPVSYDFWMLEAALAGGRSGRGEDLDARVFHLGSILLHALAAWLVFLLLRRLVGAEGPALLGALAFELHPLQVEAVAWISETRGLLAAVLGLGALLVHARGRSLARTLGSSALLALAVLAKPSAAPLPLMALALDVLVLRRPARRSALALAPWLAVVLALAWVTKRLQPDAALEVVVPWSKRPWIAADAVAFYLAKLALPLQLVPDHVRTPPRVLAGSALPAVVGALSCLAALAWSGVGAHRLRAALGVFLLGLAPVLGLIPFAHQEISTVASRFAYLALLGPALGVACLGALRPARFRPWWGLAPLLGVWMVLSFVQAGTWSDVRSTFERNLRLQPQSSYAHSLVARALERDGELEAAYAHYLEALRLGPDKHETQLDLGNVRFRQGRLEQAAEHYRAAIDLVPGYASAHRNLARALVLLRRWTEAEEHLALLLARDPDEPGLERQLARVRWWQGDAVGAAAGLARAAERAPGDVDLALDRAWLWATAAAGSLRDPARARATAEGLGRLDARREPSRLWVLAAAQAARGETDAGNDLARQAADLAARAGRGPLAQRIQAWIASCAAGAVPAGLPPLPEPPPGP